MLLGVPIHQGEGPKPVIVMAGSTGLEPEISGLTAMWSFRPTHHQPMRPGTASLAGPSPSRSKPSRAERPRLHGPRRRGRDAAQSDVRRSGRDVASVTRPQLINTSTGAAQNATA